MRGQAYCDRSWQRHRYSAGMNRSMKVARSTDFDVTTAAYNAASVEDFIAQLDDPENYVERTVTVDKKKVKQQVRRVCSVSAILSDDVYYDLIKLQAAQTSDPADISPTDLCRRGIWLVLGRDDYDEWRAEEKARVSAALKERMSGVAKDYQDKIKTKDDTITKMSSELEALKAQLAALTSKS